MHVQPVILLYCIHIPESCQFILGKISNNHFREYSFQSGCRSLLPENWYHRIITEVKKACQYCHRCNIMIIRIFLQKNLYQSIFIFLCVFTASIFTPLQTFSAEKSNDNHHARIIIIAFHSKLHTPALALVSHPVTV